MHSLSLTTLQTNIPVLHHDLEAVKKALGSWLKQKGFAQHGHIHNHETEEDPNYKKQEYPLIQLRCPQGKLMLWGMNAGAEILQQIMLQEMLRGFQFRGTQCRIIPAQTGTEKAAIGFLPGKEMRWYSLNYFVALNPPNAKAWQALPAPQKMDRLEELLKNNIAMFCKAAGYVLDKEKLKADINWVWKTEWVKIKEYPVMGFTLDYHSNLLLPDGIALGRQTKLGYGWQTIRTGSSDDLLTPLP
jgi:hypothetical protein